MIVDNAARDSSAPMTDRTDFRTKTNVRSRKDTFDELSSKVRHGFFY
jgi:hypothetical protein